LSEVGGSVAGYSPMLSLVLLINTREVTWERNEGTRMVMHASVDLDVTISDLIVLVLLCCRWRGEPDCWAGYWHIPSQRAQREHQGL
jgi:hypothetical protein